MKQIAAAQVVADRTWKHGYIPAASEHDVLRAGLGAAEQHLGQEALETTSLRSAYRRSSQRRRQQQAGQTARITDAIRATGAISEGAYLHTETAGQATYLVRMPHRSAEALELADAAGRGRRMISGQLGEPVTVLGLTRGPQWTTVTIGVGTSEPYASTGEAAADLTWARQAYQAMLHTDTGRQRFEVGQDARPAAAALHAAWQALPGEQLADMPQELAAACTAWADAARELASAVPGDFGHDFRALLDDVSRRATVLAGRMAATAAGHAIPGVQLPSPAGDGGQPEPVPAAEPATRATADQPGATPDESPASGPDAAHDRPFPLLARVRQIGGGPALNDPQSPDGLRETSPDGTVVGYPRDGWMAILFDDAMTRESDRYCDMHTTDAQNTLRYIGDAGALSSHDTGLLTAHLSPAQLAELAEAGEASQRDDAAPATAAGPAEPGTAPEAGAGEPGTGTRSRDPGAASPDMTTATLAQGAAEPNDTPTVPGPAPAGTAGPQIAAGEMTAPPEATVPLPAHAEWGGALRPGRLLYVDDTALLVRGQGDDGDLVRAATAAGAVPCPGGSDYGPGARLQVVRWDDTGTYGIVHPALACPAAIDPYAGLSDTGRQRWQALDAGEALGSSPAWIPAHLVVPGDILHVERGPRSLTYDIREAGIVTAVAGGTNITFKDARKLYFYPAGHRAGVFIPDDHPTLSRVITEAGGALPPAGSGAVTASTAGPGAAPGAATSTASGTAEVPAAGAADTGATAVAGPFTGRIAIETDNGTTFITGTAPDDPPELRRGLREAKFDWRKPPAAAGSRRQRGRWEYTGPPSERAIRIGQVRALLASLDAQTVKPLTPQQQEICDAAVAGSDLLVQALAGTGKTYTLTAVARAIGEARPDHDIVYTSFTKSVIEDAMKGRFGPNVTPSTMHALARRALLLTDYAGKLEQGPKGAARPEQWAEILGITDPPAADGIQLDAGAVAGMVMATIKKFRDSDAAEPSARHLPPDLAAHPGGPLARAVVDHARKAWADIADPGNAALCSTGRALQVSFDDYLKVWALRHPRIDAHVIMFDEAQDVNACMREVILSQADHAQLIFVGDSQQSIYAFRGAQDALPHVARRFPDARQLPLTQSWRFGPALAEYANLYLQLLGSPLRLQGNPAVETVIGPVPDPDAIICRTNATAVSEAVTAIEAGKRVAFASDRGDELIAFARGARDLKAGRRAKHRDLAQFRDWDEVAECAFSGDENYKHLQTFVRLVREHGADGLIKTLGRLVSEKDPHDLTIGTVHQAKGLEWDNVRIAGDFKGPEEDPATGEIKLPSGEALRGMYVALTRARKNLDPGPLAWILRYREPPGTGAPELSEQHAPEPGLLPDGSARRREVLVNLAAWAPPQEIPEGWLIVNAPRPVDGEKTWIGEFRHGEHWAAAPAADAGRYGWQDADAWPVRFITDEQIAAAVARYLADNNYDSAEAAGVTVEEAARDLGLPWSGQARQEPADAARTADATPAQDQPAPAGDAEAAPAGTQHGLFADGPASAPAGQDEPRPAATSRPDPGEPPEPAGTGEAGQADAPATTEAADASTATPPAGDVLLEIICDGQPAGTVVYDLSRSGRFLAKTGQAITAVITDLGGSYLRVTGPGDEATGGTVVSGWPQAATHLWGAAAQARQITAAAPAAATAAGEAPPADPAATPGPPPDEPADHTGHGAGPPPAAAPAGPQGDGPTPGGSSSPQPAAPPADPVGQPDTADGEVPDPGGAPMRFMNDVDIEQAVRRWQDHPVLGPAARTLANLAAWADRTSDGWATWPAPAKAAARLMTLIERDGTAGYMFDTERPDATLAELLKAYTPLKTFRTRHNADFAIEDPREVTTPADGDADLLTAAEPDGSQPDRALPAPPPSAAWHGSHRHPRHCGAARHRSRCCLAGRPRRARGHRPAGPRRSRRRRAR